MNTKGVFSHASDEWSTPRELFNRLHLEFGFTLDPCSTDENALCIKHYTKNNNGLDKSWNGETVFVNPPYSQAAAWVEKAASEWNENTTIVLLLPSRTDTKFFHKYIYKIAEIRFIKGRLKFGNSKNSAPFPSMIVIYNKEVYENVE